MNMSEILRPEAVYSPLKVQSKKRLFQEMAQGAAALLNLRESDILSTLLERETLGPTGVGHGVALPHGRLAGLGTVEGLFFRLETPIDFDSVDRKPVDLVFCLLAPEDAGASHLRALAQVSRLMRSEQICSKIRSTREPQAIFSIMTTEEASEAA